jgi:two-component system nitrate/nitrite response regulator NarL
VLFLIVDDHAVLRKGLSALLQQAKPDSVVLEASEGAQGLELARLHPNLDVVFLDLKMPGLGGVPAIEAFGAQHPDLPLIVLSSSEDPHDVRRVISAGALGYIPKSANANTLVAALEMVLQGQVYLPPLLLNEQNVVASAVEAAPARGAGRLLTERQTEVLALIARGLSNKEIARALGLSEKTVKVHVGGLFRALDVANRMQATNEARKLGIKLEG